ncbi:HNH endonuclease [Acinetobacter baumannii]|uniref:HNH endonuclease n=1 Tax=Acinetobacter baumannii TaxID=470 RepID=UPI000DE6DBAB|nr:HNH endonuclease [Acinetobacter baumannii]EJB8411835.1 HNH endonuclease [Acinetobacter baumannii]MCT9384842.1 HNH endonuclease [Acinetobacter baumannii]MDC4723436.1 HNH endonuclease [Acinetobacter baumannii]MDC5535821.1 HNH endonuclease [Acinetobacter baumannii]MDV7634353.1 HNH endonuclease [Acinetobacter baumannii]
MKKLDKPNYDFDGVLDLCVNNILRGNQDLKDVIQNDKNDILLDGKCYERDANNGQLYSYQELKRCHNSVPISLITKDHYIHLYETYFVPETKIETRKIYDAILNAAKEECPFCGGLGVPKNLDHFLPKTKFPQFSVFPINLIPACLDCNLDSKKVSYATSEDEQTIHPYLDKSNFFNEQWITADYIVDADNHPGRFNYYVKAPEHWNNVDKIRAQNYFEDFKLASRYAKQATSSLKPKLRFIQREIDKGVSIQEIIRDVIQPDIDEAPFVNYWEVGMCDGLIRYLNNI